MMWQLSNLELAKLAELCEKFIIRNKIEYETIYTIRTYNAYGLSSGYLCSRGG